MKWTKKDIDYLRENYPNLPASGMVERLCRKVGAIQAKAYVLGLCKTDKFYKSSLSGRLDGTQGKNHWFRKGQKPKCTLPIGAMVQRAYGNRMCWSIKTEHGWQYYHRWLWEQNFGEIPKGQVIMFRNGDSLDCRLSNFRIVSKKEEQRYNKVRRKNSEAHKRSWHRAKIRYKAVLPPVSGYGELIENGKYKI